MRTKLIALFTVLFLSVSFAQFDDTLIDFNTTGTLQDSDDEKLKMLYNENWRAVLNSSADFLPNRKLTYVKNVGVTATEFNNFEADGNVLGVRVNFPQNDYNSYAKVKPMIEIESYAGDDGDLYVGYGLLKNVGLIKNIKGYVKGKNFPHTMYINLLDANGELTAYPMGPLNFDGWETMVYQNQMYLDEVRNRRLTRIPLYPRVEPLVKLESIQFFRHGSSYAGDFIAYVGWINVEYDKAIIDEDDDIDDEAVWEIRSTESDLKAAAEKERLDRTAELEELERKKMNLSEEEDTAATTTP